MSNETATANIPVTDEEIVSLQCQFCVNDEPHAVLILSEIASFNVSDPTTRVTCLTAQVINGQRVLLCRGAQQVSFHLNVCVDNSNCVQFPVILATCPLNPQTAIPTQQVTFPSRTPPPITLPVSTPTPVPTQTVSSPPSPTATFAFPQPTLIVPGTTQPPETGLQDPAQFARWYFEAVWKIRNYQDLWDHYLTPSFKAHVGSGNYADYVAWWNSVDRVDVNSIDVIENDGTHAWIRVNVTFHMRDGRVISNQEYNYDLLYDANRQIWMFDFRG